MNTVHTTKSEHRRRKRDEAKAQRSVMQKIIRAFGLILITLIILLALLVGIGRAYIDANPQIIDQLTQKLGQRLGMGMKVEDIGVRWRWSGPQVTIDSLEFNHPETKQTLVTFENAQVVLDVKRYIKTRIVGVSSVRLQGADFFLNKSPEKTFYLNGVELNEIRKIFSSQSNIEKDALQNKAKTDVNYPKGIFEFQDINFVYQDDETKKEIRLADLSTQINNNDQLLRLQISGEADNLVDQLKITLSTPNPELHENLSWQIILEAENLQLAELTSQWANFEPILFGQQTPQMLAPENKLQFSEGSSDIKVFMRYADQRIKAMNGTVGFNSMELARSSAKDTVTEKEHLSGLGFRFLYENEKDLTNFRIDKIKLDGVTSNWPDDNVVQFKRLIFSQLQTENIVPIQRKTINKETPVESQQENTSIKIEQEFIEIDRTINNLMTQSYQVDSAVKNIKLAELKTNYINLTDLAPLLEVLSGFIPDDLQTKKVAWQEVRGILKDVYLELDNPQNKASSFSDASATLSFENLSIPSINYSASLSGLTGALNYKDNHGVLNIASNALVYENLDLFMNKINIDTFVSDIKFKNELEQWHLTSDSVMLENPDFLINTNLDVLIKKDASPIVDVMADIKPKNLDRIKYYYPTKVMSETLVTWLEDRVSGGTIDNAKIQLNGALEDYPFRNKKGEYLTEFTVNNLDVNYADGWPAVRLEKAELTFKNESFEIDASVAKTGELASFPLQAGFKDLGNSPLTLSIQTALDIQATKEWINTSPLRESVGEAIKSIHVTGETQSKIDIVLPLDNLDGLMVNGQIDFSGNELKLDALDDSFLNLVGRLNFSKEDFYADELSAIYQGEKIEASIKPQDEATMIELHTEAQLGSFLGDHFSSYVTGNSTVDAEVRISGQAGVGIDNIKLRSNLLGSGLSLPAPFEKAEDTLLPLNINIDVLQFSEPSLRQQLRLSGNAGDNLLQARFDSTENNLDSDWSLRSITIVGGDNASLFDSINPEQPRVSVLGNFSHVDFDEWLDFLNNESKAQTNEALEIGIISVNLKRLDAIGQSFPDTQVLLEPDLNEWNATINNSQVVGNIKFPRPWLEDSLIEANLEKYHLLLPEDETEEVSFDPREIPNVSLIIKDFQLASMPMGQTSLRVKKESNGARIENFNIINSTFEINGSGGWFKTTEGETSLVSLQLSSKDLASTLKQLGYAPAASARSADALIELDWPGSPFVDILQDVSGSVSFKLLNGDLREVEPGAGRFLALLSIAQLPKRLSLDFRDVFNSGLQYDELSADFSIHQGQAYTNNMLMRGPVADLGVVGRVGLATRDFEQAAVVQADLGSSLPIAGALAGGLGVGAALLIFSEIFKNPLKQATQVFYKIDGDWGSPKIERTNPGNLTEIPIAPR